MTFNGGRRALAFGEHKINLHQAGAEFEPKALRPTPGSADFCLITDVPIADVIAHLGACGVESRGGTRPETGEPRALSYRSTCATLDGNLVEISNYVA